MADAITDELLDVAARYIQAKGGKALVIGGIEIIQMPSDREHNFRLAICFTGKRPVKPAP